MNRGRVEDTGMTSVRPRTVSRSSWPPAVRMVVSLGLLVYLAAVIVPPLAGPPPASDLASASAQALHRRVAPYRQEVLAAVARGELDLDAGTARLEAIRWLRRVSQHLERACYHLGAIGASS